jgi:hypothetical protein
MAINVEFLSWQWRNFLVDLPNCISIHILAKFWVMLDERNYGELVFVSSFLSYSSALHQLLSIDSVISMYIKVYRVAKVIAGRETCLKLWRSKSNFCVRNRKTLHKYGFTYSILLLQTTHWLFSPMYLPSPHQCSTWLF